MEAILLLLFIGYCVVGAVVGRRFYLRRHGVRLGTGWEGMDSGWTTAVGVSLIWPAAPFLPAIREPEPCTHSHHVLARQEERDRASRVADAVRRERGL